MTKANKSICAMDRILRDMGWIQVGTDLSGIFQKKHCYFVMYPQEEKPIILSNSQKRLGVGAELMVHDTGKSWYVEKDGFFVESGSIGRFISAAFEYGFEGSDYERAVEFAKQINRFADMDDSELARYQKKEQRSVSKGEKYQSLSLSGRKLSVTGMFIANPKVNPKITKVFDEGVVYEIIDSDGTKVTITDQAHSESAKVDLDLLSKLEEGGALCSIETEEVSTEKEVWSYVPFMEGECTNVPEEFKDFRLSLEQESVLSAAMDAGVNFTVLLNRNLGVDVAKRLLTVLRLGGDCLPLAGKNVTAEHADFLVGIADNGYPINGFCDENEDVSSMKERYSQILEGIDYSLRQHQITGETASDIRKIAFRMHGYQKEISSGYSGAKLYLVGLLEDERFGRLAGYMMENGVFSGGHRCSCSWIAVPQDVRVVVKNLFYAEGLSVEGRNWNHYLEDSINKAESITYSPQKGFQLCFRMLKVGTDGNSIYLADSSDTVVWRSVLVNEKYYTYRSNLVAALL